jgi:hypothetical protein
MGNRACICGVVGCTRHGYRPTRNLSAWGGDHKARRKRMHEGLRNGTIPAVCARCGQGPRLGDPWEAGHVQAVALGGGGEVRPEHRSCNRRHGAQLRAALRKYRIEQRAAIRIAKTTAVFSHQPPRRPLPRAYEKSSP